MKRKLTLTLALLIVCSLLLASCGASHDSANYGVRDDVYLYADAEETESVYVAQNSSTSGKGFVTTDGDAGDYKTAPETQRKIIYTSDFEIQTKDYPASVSALNALCEKYGAYFESSNTYGNESTSRRSNYTIRVPVANYASFISETGNVGVIISSSEYNEDITERYFDTEARLESALLREERVLKILENAASLDDVLALERELSDIRYEIESYTGSLRKFDSLVSYSTVRLSISEVKSIVTPPEQVLTFGERVKVSFENGIEDFTNGFENFVVFLSYNFIGILVWIVILAVAICVIVSARKKRVKKAAKKKTETPETKDTEKESENK